MMSQNWLYISQLVDVLESWFFFCFHGFLGHWVQKCYWFLICVMTWRHDVMSFVWWRDDMTSSHDVTKHDLPILACRCARKLILFLFPWFFRSLSSNMLLVSSFVWWLEVMTSCHDVTKLDLPISACRCARKLILFLFPGIFRSLSSKMILIFHVCDDVMSWRHVMTSQNLIYLSQFVDLLESWFFFCFHGILGHWVRTCNCFFICVMTWRHDVMSWRHKYCFTYLRFWIC